jgi:hypothetical protein
VEKRVGEQAERRDQLQNLMEWSQRVAGNLPTLTYSQKRDLLTALDVSVKLYQKGKPTPRWEISMSLDDIVCNTSAVATP